MENNNSRENQSQDFGTRVFATSNQVINNFRTKIEKKMQSFASSPSTETKIPISIAEEIKSLESTDEKLKVTMEILKYVVYEQVEEIGAYNLFPCLKRTNGNDKERTKLYPPLSEGGFSNHGHLLRYPGLNCTASPRGGGEIWPQLSRSSKENEVCKV